MVEKVVCGVLEQCNRTESGDRKLLSQPHPGTLPRGERNLARSFTDELLVQSSSERTQMARNTASEKAAATSTLSSWMQAEAMRWTNARAVEMDHVERL